MVNPEFYCNLTKFILTEFCKHANDGHFVGPVDDVIDGCRCG